MAEKICLRQILIWKFASANFFLISPAKPETTLSRPRRETTLHSLDSGIAGAETTLSRPRRETTLHSPLSRLRHRRSRDHSLFAPTSPETAYLILNSIRVNIVVAADFVLDRRSPEAVLP